MDWMWMFAGGGSVGLALVGYGIMSRLQQPARPRIPEARCSCGHGSGLHGVPDGRCTAAVTVTLESYTSSRGTDRSQSREQCTCVRYDGPDPEHLRLLRGGA